MKSAPGLHRDHRGVADVVVGAELGRLQDHLEVRVAAVLLDRDDLLHHAGVVAGQERLARDHHVDLVGAGRDRVLGVAELGFERDLAGGKAGGHGWPSSLRCRGAPPRPWPRAAGTRRSRRPIGISGIVGAGHTPLAHRWRTLPAVSAPSSVVRSSIDTARRMPCCLAVVLIERLPSCAARSSMPTRSTWGRRRITLRGYYAPIMKRVLVFCGSSPGRRPSTPRRPRSSVAAARRSAISRSSTAGRAWG